ncbi:MAG TPA: PQQ-dependent sugar dehydrogenase [Candidatus Limnocylindrales bacterium]|nr:PQQ-dependent sugar dehydrogenase [Candidatus Limnocylindrales bacterium]
MPGHLRRRSFIITLILLMVAALAPQSASAAAPTMSTAVIADGLVYPWDVAFVPDGTMLVTERPGRVRVYSSGAVGASLVRTITIPSVRAEGEAGLMGIAVDVDFATNRFVYVCASRTVSGSWVNQVLRYKISASGSWVDLRVLLGGMRANNIHNGCALEMDRFGKLWVAMGDSADPARAQNRNSNNGKILRINRDGSVPSDNPSIGGTRNAVYSMGHRNPQGIAIRPGTDQVYAIEHGPDVNDEINLIVAGGNYGWPCYTGAGSPYQTAGCGPATSYRNSLWSSGGSTIATSGGTFAAGAQWADYNGQLFVSTLKQMDVRRFPINPAGTTISPPALHFDNSWGRLRAMVYGPGGQLYVTTSDGTDSVVRISPSKPALSRVAGSDRYATAAALSRSGFPNGSARVFVATGLDFPDALAGGAAAGHFSNPVLLVKNDQIPAATRAELDRLNPSSIVVLGGTSVVQEAIRNQLVPYASSGEVRRISGSDRYETAAAISSAYYAPGTPAAFIATGTGFADALAGAPAAALRDSPLLLVKPTSIPAATQAELTRLQPQQIFVLGGGSSVSSAVGAALHDYTAGAVTRLSGADRYATGAAIARTFWGKSRAYVATGLTFADALGAGAVAGKAGVPLLLVAGTSVPLATGQEVLRLGAHRLTVAGGTGAVSTGAETILKRLMGTP